jgi:hypothetical protein
MLHVSSTYFNVARVLAGTRRASGIFPDSMSIGIFPRCVKGEAVCKPVSFKDVAMQNKFDAVQAT